MGDTILISGLESLIPPDPVTGWPPAPGWYIVAGVLLLFVAGLILRSFRKRRLNRFRRAALDKLGELQENGHEGELSILVQGFNRILKQTALATYQRERVASLSGSEWIQFLMESCPAMQLSSEQQSMLATNGYQKKMGVKGKESHWNDLVKQGETWIRRHRRGPVN